MPTSSHPVLQLRRGLATLLLLGMLPVAAQGPVQTKRVLIATEASSFKDAVVVQLAETLRKDGHAVDIIGLDLLGAQTTGNFQAIVLVNSCRAWRPSSAVRNFLKTLSDADKKKLVVLTTANSGECDLNVGGVDVISAASKRTGIATVSQTVVDKLRARLAAP
jgi:hypothetical protein